MLFNYLIKNFKKDRNSPEDIELQIEIARSDYQREIDAIRAKYAKKFISLAAEYNACATTALK